MKFAFIQAQKAEFPVEVMCKHFGVSRSGYYAFCLRSPSRRKAQDAALSKAIATVHQRSRGTYGRPRVQAALRGEGFNVSSKRVGRLMKQEGLQSRRPRRVRNTTDSGHKLPVAENVLARAFFAQAPCEAWVGDITFIPTAQGWLYLAVLLDLFSRRVVGWAMSETIDRSLCLSALRMALRSCKPKPGLLHHTDRGSQYASLDYQAALRAAGLVSSMSRKGNCWDNAVAESFFATLKQELCHLRSFASRDEARRAIFEYIEVFYNRQRLHSSLDYRTPIEYEANHASLKIVA